MNADLIDGVEAGSFVCAEQHSSRGGIHITVADSSGAPAMGVTLSPRACDRLLAQIKAIYDAHGYHLC